MEILNILQIRQHCPRSKMALNGKQFYVVSLNVCLMVFNATFNNISVYIKAVSFIGGENFIT
jgi:hypothetical protein